MSRGDIFARRGPSARGRVRGAVGSVVAPSPPSTTIGTIAAANGSAPSWNVRADYGYALGAGGGVSDLLDLSGNGWSFSQPVEGSQPLWLPTDANGFPAIQGDGVDDALINAFSRPAIVAGTPSTHVWIAMVASQITWTLDDTLWSDGGATIIQGATSSGLRLFCGAFGTQNNNFSGYKLIFAQFSASTSSYMQIGGTFTGSGPVGTTAGGTDVLLAAPGGVRFFNGKIAEIAKGLGDLSGPAFTAIQGYASARYGASVLT